MGFYILLHVPTDIIIILMIPSVIWLQIKLLDITCLEETIIARPTDRFMTLLMFLSLSLNNLVQLWTVFRWNKIIIYFTTVKIRTLTVGPQNSKKNSLYFNKKKKEKGKSREHPCRESNPGPLD